MKKLFSLLAVLLFAGSMMAAEATLKYSGSTTTNMVGNGANNAATLGLDENLFTVLADKGGNSNFPGLNKAGDIRLYASSGNGNSITVSIASGSITSIVLDIKQTATFVVKAGSVDVEEADGKYAINASSFTIKNTTTGASTQLQLNKITITYTSEGGEEQWAEITFTAATAAGAFNDSVFAAGDFKLTCVDTDKSKLKTTANNCVFGNSAEDKVSYAFRLQTSGKSSAKNALNLTIPADGQVRIAVRTGSSSDATRTVILTQDETELYNKVVTDNDTIEGATNPKIFKFITVDVKKGTVAVTYPVNALNFYSFAFKAAAEPTPEPAVANYCQTEITHFNLPAETASAVLLSVGVKGEKTIVRIDKKNAEAANLDFLQVTPNNVGSQLEEGGSEALAVEFNTPTPVNDSLTLEILWSTVGNPGNWMVQNLRVAVADCQYATIPVTPITCAEVYSKAKDDKVALNDVTVTYANGKNVYVKDETGSMLLYLTASTTWKAGDKLSGIEGTLDIYKNLYEVKMTAEQVAAVTATAGEAPAPVEFAAAPVAADMNKYIIVKNVSVAAGEFTTSSATNLDLTIGDATVVLRNNFKLAQTFAADKLYDVTAVVAVYNDAVQLYFISAEEKADPRLKGAYKIGGDAADYAKLSDAIAAIEANGMSGDVDLLICADLAENVNIGVTNNSEYTLTIRPDKAEKRTITYGDQADNDGPSGHILVGALMAKDFNTTLATKNVWFDGSVDGEGQYLEIRAGAVGGRTIVFYGDVTNSGIKNCRIINPRATGTNYAVEIRTEKSTDKRPVGIVIENNYIEDNGSPNTQAIQFNGSQSATADGKPKDVVIRNNEIVANLRGIFFNGAENAVIEGNTFRLAKASAGFLAHGIMGNVQKGTIIVRGNKFLELGTMNVSAGEYGICGITASGNADVWVIENNVFAGLDAKADVAGKIVTLRYVRCGDSCVVRNNTFYLPAQTYKPATDLVAAQAVTCLWLAGTKQYVAENNLLVSEETEANNSLIRGALNENVKNNVFFHKGGNAAVLAGAVVAKTWEEFAALEGTAGSKWTEPKFVDAANGDFAIAEYNEGLLIPRLESVLKDIDGKDRAEQTCAGAYEGPENSPGTGLDAIETEGAQKLIRNGEVLIIRNGKTYNMMGQIVK